MAKKVKNQIKKIKTGSTQPAPQGPGMGGGCVPIR